MMGAGDVQHAQRSHALLSASGASRWINCTPSARMEEAIPERSKGTTYAAEGTLAHEFADIGLRLAFKEISTSQYNSKASKLRQDELYSSEMEGEVDKYIDYCLEEYGEALSRDANALVSVEERVDLTRFIPEGFGTNDFVVIADQVLSVVDLKYGKGVRVSAVDNSQLKLYGLGSLYKYMLSYDIKEVRLSIVQPRLDHISTWSISSDELLKWGEDTVTDKADLAFNGEGDVRPGEWCQWCKAKAVCSALAERSLEDARLDFAETEPSDPKLLQDSDVLAIYAKSAFIRTWLDAVDAYVLASALDGKSWEGYKIVEGRSVRKWANEEQVAQALLEAGYSKEDIMRVKLAGIGDIEKLVGKKQFPAIIGDLVIKPEGKPTLVPEDDKRTALSAKIFSEFD